MTETFSVAELLAVLAAGGAGWLAMAPAHRPRSQPAMPSTRSPQRRPWAWAGVAGIGIGVFFGGILGILLGALVAGWIWHTLASAETPADRRAREAAEGDLPHVVSIFATVLAGGAPPSQALATVCAALPGGAVQRLHGVQARLALGEDPVTVWGSLADDPVLSGFGRAMTTALRTGAPVARSARQFADDLRIESLARREHRARTVGVRAAVPLGLCLLPAFLLIGIVPVAVGLFRSLLQ